MTEPTKDGVAAFGQGSTTAVPAGTCLTHGYHGCVACPSCSTSALPPTRLSAPAALVPTIGSRDVAEARELAEEAVREYAEAAKFWNTPDDEHTRISLRRLVEEIIEEVVPDARS